MCILLDWLKSIPDVIWSGVIASILTLSGVLISNASSTKRLRAQLAHDASEKFKDRKASLRREVYLKAAEELVKANMYLASLPSVDISTTNVGSSLQDFFVAASKLALVSDAETTYQVNELIGSYGGLVLQLTSRVMPIQTLKSDIAIRTDHYNGAQAEISRLLASMKHFNESVQTDARVFDVLQKSFTFQQEHSATLVSERAALWKKMISAQIEFSRYLLSELGPITNQQIRVMIEIRKELGLDGELEAFVKQMEKQRDRMSVQTEKLFQELSKLSGDVE